MLNMSKDISSTVPHTFSLFFSSSDSLYNAAIYKTCSGSKLTAVYISEPKGIKNIQNLSVKD